MKKKPIYKALSFFLSICLIAATITVPAFAAATLTMDNIEDVTVAVGDKVNIPLSATMESASEGMTNLVFSIDGGNLPNGLNLIGNSITGTADTVTGQTQITIGATADDGVAEIGIKANSVRFNITVAALNYTWNPTTTINAITGNGITGTVGGATTNSKDNTRTISYSSADKPNWLTINADGTFSGTPTTNGTFSFNVKAALAGDATGVTKQFTIEVADPVITWNPSSTTLDPGVVGKAYDSVNIANGASTNGTGDVTFESNNMPAGLDLAADGTITGIPTAAVDGGKFNVTAKADNAAEVVKEFTITIAERAVTLDPIVNQTATVGIEFTLRPSADTNTGETINFSYEIAGGKKLPTDFSFEPTTGVISGTITEQNGLAAEGEYNVTITATIDGDTANPISVDRSFTLTVDYPRVELQPITNVDNAIATKAITNINASEGLVNTTADPNVVYSQIGLPSGLSLNSQTGVISGTPAMDDLDQGAAKTYTVQVTATADGKSDSVTFDITVNPPAFVDAPSDLGSQEIMEGKAITAVDVAAAFAGTYTGGDTVAYTLEGVVGPNGGTALPGTVAFNGTTLNGTTAQGTKGTYALTFKATAQTSGAEATATYTLTVGERKFTTSTLTNDTLKLGAEYSKDVKSAFVYNDPDATVSYEVTSSEIKGLSFNSDTGIFSGKITDKSLVSDTPVQITVKAKDTANQFESDPVSFELTIQGLAFTEFNVPSELTAYAGYNFTNSDINATFEEAGVGLEFAAPDLPSGLSIDANTGEISGPVAADATGGTVTVTVTDQKYGYTASKDINFTVKTPSIAITKPEDVTVYEGYEYTQVIPEATADVPDSTQITYNVINLPGDMSFDSTTRTISGAAAAGANANSPYTVQIQVSDGTTTSQETFDMTVKAPVLTIGVIQKNAEIFAGNSADINVGWTYEGPKTASATVKGLPEGLTYANGKITGTVTAAAVKADPYTVEVTVTDGVKTEKMSFNITVKAKAEVPPVQKPEELKWDGNTEGATNMEIRFDVPFEQFTGQVYFNGALLRNNVDYTAKSGSTVITLTNSFLKSLKTGDYNVEAVFMGSIGKASVNVVAAATTPTTTTSTTATPTTATPTTADNSTDVTVPDPNKPGTDAGDSQITAESTAPAAGTTTTAAKSDEGDSPKTGDNNALLILIVLTILAGGATMVLYKKRKKA